MKCFQRFVQPLLFLYKVNNALSFGTPFSFRDRSKLCLKSSSSNLFPHSDHKSERESIQVKNETDAIDPIRNEFEILHPSSILGSVDHAKHKKHHIEEESKLRNRPNIENIQKLLRLKRAQVEFASFSQEDSDRIFRAVAQAANFERLPLAKLAFEETAMGCFEDKVLKNGLACELIFDRYKNSKTCGLISEDTFHGIKKYAYPAGPICALIPVTNPTSTVIAKSLMMAKTRNVGIFLPHPKASKSSCEAVRICCEAGERAGAPKGWLQSVDHPSMDETNRIMRSDEVRRFVAMNFTFAFNSQNLHCIFLIQINLLLSTGGPGVVKASYQSGKPAIGVGGGNAPVRDRNYLSFTYFLKSHHSLTILGSSR